MAINLPPAINLHNTSVRVDPLGFSEIGSPSNVSTKSAGNLPITSVAAQYVGNTVGTLQGLGWSLPLAFNSNTSHKILIWAWQFNAPNRIQVNTTANDGIIGLIYTDGSLNDFREYRLGGNDTPAGNSQGGALPFVIDPSSSTFSFENGTYNSNNITGYAFATKRLNISGNSTTQAFFTRAFLFGTEKDDIDIPKFTGTSNFNDIITTVLGTDYTTKIHTFVSVAGSTYTLLCPFQIGDGLTTTTFNDNGATVLSPSSNDPSDPRFHLSDKAMRVHLSLTASDNIKLSGKYIWGTEADFNFDSSVGATVNLSGSLFSGMGNVTLNSDVTTGNATFSIGNNSVIDNGANIENINITEGNLTLNILKDLTNVTAQKLIITLPGTYNLTNVNVNEVENTSLGQVNIISDKAIPVITNTGTGSTTTLLDSLLRFTNDWELYLTQSDRNSNTNLVASGSSSDTYNFEFNPGTTYYFWVAGTKQQKQPLQSGETLIDLSTPTLLNLVNENLSFINRVVYCDITLPENGDGSNSNPFNSLDSAIIKYNEGSFTSISLKTSLLTPATTTLPLDGVKIIGANPTAHLALTGNSMNSGELDDLLLQGVQGPTFLPSTYRGCSIVGNTSGLIGKLENTQILSLTGTDVVISFGGSTAIIGCNVTNVGLTTFDLTGGVSVAIRNITGSFIMSNIQDGSTVSVDSISGNLILEPSCIGGNIRIFDTIKIIDNSAGTNLDIEDLPTLKSIEESTVLAKKQDLSVLNEGIKKSSLLIPHNDDI